MAESPIARWLDGQVEIHRLPEYRIPPGDDAPTVKRLLLAQGELAQCYDAEDGLRYVAMLELVEGGIRGNHFHRVKAEWIYLMRGELLLVVEWVETRERASVPLRAGERAFVRPGVAHALKTIGPGLALEFSTARYDSADTFRYPLL